jgi:nickel/cobalt transporter (NiCoT) family protein
LRHAFDADHIAAIDNVTRKLMQEGRRPVSAGLFFAFGHSTVVVGLTLAVGFAAVTLEGRFGLFRDIGGMIGTTVSALFLFAIAAANMVVLARVYRSFNALKAGGSLNDAQLEAPLSARGPFSWLLRGAFRLIERSWHMFPLGFLFGLGFDTATEVGLLGISASQATHGLSTGSILVFPVLFAAGMLLMDTTDSSLMVGAYGWAFVKPVRKLYYNMTITFVSVVAALLIGGIEALGVVAGKAGFDGPFWVLISKLSNNLGLVGYGVVAFFLVSWIASFAIYKIKGYDGIGVRA